MPGSKRASSELFTRTIKDSVYQTDVTVCIGPYGSFRRWFAKRHFMDQLPFADRVPCGKTVEFEYDNDGVKSWYVWFPDHPDVSLPALFATLVHESFHVSTQILRDRGLSLTRESEEAFAYHMTDVFRNVLQTFGAYDEQRQRAKKRQRAEVSIRKRAIRKRASRSGLQKLRRKLPASKDRKLAS